MSQSLIENEPKDEDMTQTNDLVYSLDTFETDSKLCIDLIHELSLVSDNKNETEINVEIEKICERFDYLINKYQTNPKLIESHLNTFLESIIQIITKCEPNGHKFNASFTLLYRLVTCVGHKSVCRYFPTEVLWLTKLLDWIEVQNASDSESWHTRSCILLWLSIAVKTPFHLRKFDSNERNSEQNSVINRIYKLIDQYLKVGDKSRDSAAVLAASFFSRPDIVDTLLTPFMNESIERIKSFTTNSAFSQTHFGHVIALAILFKATERKVINSFAARVIEIAVQLDTSGHELLSKCKIKLIGRSALSLMAPRIAKWRYRRGRRLLTQNISLQMSDENKNCEQILNDNQNEDQNDFIDIPEQIEAIIESLLKGLQHNSTIVRWSSAKYLARITNRLPKELATDVVTYILQLCEWKDSDCSWHGCCLALAELIRRGLILVQQLPEIIVVIEKALIFDEIKGMFSVGSNVRDAASYMCWSMSRAYEPQDIEKYVHKLAPTLVCVTCFDREVNCRRAASAAIQEFVGRTQVFPHGNELMGLTDFYSLANRSHCYLEIALTLAEKEEFGQSLTEHLVMKCQHWDREIREIVAQSMGALASIIDMNPFLPNLIAKSTSMDLNSRHGSILSIAHIIGSIGGKIKPEFVEQIESIASVLSEKRLLRGIGGEFMKSALSVLIEKSSSVSLPINGNVFEVWIEVISESLTSEDVKTRKEAVLAVPVFCQNYLINELELKEKILNLLIRHLGSFKESARIGSSESLRLISNEVLNNEFYDKCFDIIVSHIKSNDQFCTSRASEVITLVELSLKFQPIPDSKRQLIFESICLALDDRTVDSRGDVGGNVRLSAINASLLFINHLTNEEILRILNLMSTLCVSKWRKERTLATNAFKRIIFSEDFDAIDRQLLKSFEFDSEDEWKPFIKLLNMKTFTYNLWRGLVKCVSDPTETLVRNLLKQELKSVENNVFVEFLNLYANSLYAEQLSLCCVGCSHFLLTSCRTDDHFRTKVLSLTWDCVRKVKDVRKLVAAVEVFCAAIQLGLTKQSLKYLVIFLCHSFPRVRAVTANQIYVSLLTVEDISEEVLTLLTETDWCLPLDQLRPIRDHICDALGVQKPTIVTKTRK